MNTHEPGLLTDEMRRPRRGAAAMMTVVFLAALLCYLPLPMNSPLAGTEGHRALTAHQMVESGQWIVPRLYGRVYLAKPPLHYWIIGLFEKGAGALHLFNQARAPFIWRLPSALEGALLAALLAWFGNHWFGRAGGYVSGLAYISLITLWGEDRDANIDVTNTLCAITAALCIVEAHVGNVRRWYWWTLAAGLATGASLLTKGPAGMTIIAGTMLGAAGIAFRQGGGRSLLRPSLWAPLLIGAALFAAWALACRHYIMAHHLPLDTSGWEEGQEDLLPHVWQWRRILEWLILPPLLFVYSLPVSAALPMAFFPDLRGPCPRRGRLMITLSASVLLAWGLCFLSGMHLPRYAFVTLPPMCLLAGAMAWRIPLLHEAARAKLRFILIAAIVVIGLAIECFTVLLWPHSAIRPLLNLVALATPVVTAAAVCLLLADAANNKRPSTSGPGWRGAWGWPVLLLLLAALFACHQHYEHQRHTSQLPGQRIGAVVGPDARLETCAMVLDQPDLFYYADLPTHAQDGDLIDYHQIAPGTWCVLEKPELDLWRRTIRHSMGAILPFVANGNQGYLVYYYGSTDCTTNRARPNR